MASMASKDRPGDGISRRVLLRAGMAIAGVGLVPEGASGADMLVTPELFVFRAPYSKNTVIGLTMPPRHGCLGSAARTVRIHAGVKTWTAELSASGGSRITQGNHIVIFCGRGRVGSDAVDSVVLELQAHEFASTETLDVWAEVLCGNALRYRVGNPYVAELVRRDQELAQAYHRISPADDRAVLTSAVTENIAEQAKVCGMVTDPATHARRLANAILPDVVSYTPDLPVGFSFARQNGRHPAERTSEIVSTMLCGAASPVASVSRAVPLDSFPYLISPINLT
jgi:hypothetical protein